MNTYKRHRFPPDIISYAVWLYYRFNLSHRDIEDLLAQRGITVSREAIRLWCIKSGAIYTRRLKRKHPGYGDTSAALNNCGLSPVLCALPLSILARCHAVPAHKGATKTNCFGVVQQIRDLRDRQLGSGQVLAGKNIFHLRTDNAKAG